MKEIILTQGQTVLVDDEDYERLSQYNLFANKAPNGKYYPCRSIGNKYIKMGRDILNTTMRERAYYLNGNTLDCRKVNLSKTPPTRPSRKGTKTCGCLAYRYYGDQQ